MPDVTVIGLGAMGVALARTLIAADLETVVWNRTPARSAPLVAAGATTRSTPAEAIAASPIMVVCVSNYAASDTMLRTTGAQAALGGRVIVQLSTGSPRLARDAHQWASVCGASFLAGHIQAYPREIGHPDTAILLSGSEEGFARCEALMRVLAPASAFLGPDPGGALVMSLAITLAQLASRCGVMQGLAVCEAAGLSRQQFAALAGPHLTRGVRGSFKDAFALDDPTYQETQAAIRVWKTGLPSAMEVVADAGCDAALVQCFDALLDRAIALGWEGFGVAALSKSLQGKACSMHGGKIV